jgi:hypothetical protein
MLKSFLASAISVELNGLETIIGAVYQSPRKPLEEDDLYYYPKVRSMETNAVPLPSHGTEPNRRP